MLHILQSSAKKKMKVQHTESLKKKIWEKNSFIQLLNTLSYYHTTSQNVRWQWTIEILKRKENFKRSHMKKNKIYKKLEVLHSYKKLYSK